MNRFRIVELETGMFMIQQQVCPFLPFYTEAGCIQITRFNNLISAKKWVLFLNKRYECTSDKIKRVIE